MSISEKVSFDKEGHIVKHSVFDKLYLALVIILTASLSFGVGRLSVTDNREPVRIEYDSELTTDNIRPTTKTSQTANVLNAVQEGSVVGSSKGTKYHYSHCPGAKQISEKNKIVFQSASAAESAGYTLASNCKPR